MELMVQYADFLEGRKFHMTYETLGDNTSNDFKNERHIGDKMVKGAGIRIHHESI